MKFTAISIVFALLSANALADAARGKTLHDEMCMKCHDTSVYTRENRFIDSPAALSKQVNRCKANVGAQWFDEDVADVVDYLNQSFYRFQ